MSVKKVYKNTGLAKHSFTAVKNKLKPVENPSLYRCISTDFIKDRRKDNQLRLGDYAVSFTKDGSKHSLTNEIYIKQCESCGNEFSFCTHEDMLNMENYVQTYPNLNDVTVNLMVGKKDETIPKIVVRFKQSKNCKPHCKAETRQRQEALTATCEYCGKIFDTTASQAKKYCGKECQMESQTLRNLKNSADSLEKHKLKREVIIKKWVAGEIHGGSGKAYELATYLRKYLVDNAKGKCQRCGYAGVNKFTGLRNLALNHIDHNPYNHMFYNLEVICHNCHGELTQPSYMNKGRVLRKKLLDEGAITLEEFKGNSVPSAAEAGGYKRKAYETEQAKNIMLEKIALTTNKKSL